MLIIKDFKLILVQNGQLLVLRAVNARQIMTLRTSHANSVDNGLVARSCVRRMKYFGDLVRIEAVLCIACHYLAKDIPDLLLDVGLCALVNPASLADEASCRLVGPRPTRH